MNALNWKRGARKKKSIVRWEGKKVIKWESRGRKKTDYDGELKLNKKRQIEKMNKTGSEGWQLPKEMWSKISA